MILGIPISEHDLSANAARLEVKVPQSQPKPNNIILVRSRIFYAKPAFATTGLVRPGFKHIREKAHLVYKAFPLT